MLMDYRSVVSQFRDQYAVCSFHGLPVGPLTLTTTPVPLRKPRARHDLNSAGPHERRASVCGRRRRFAPASLRQALLYALRSTFPPPSADRSSSNSKGTDIILPWHSTDIRSKKRRRNSPPKAFL